MSHIQSQTLPLGTHLGVYEIKEVSKIDMFQITYRAWNHHLKEWVMIQEYFPQNFVIRANTGLNVEAKSPNDKKNFDYGLNAFLDQAENLSQIEHPNVVKAENILQFNKTAYLVTGFQDGALLAKLTGSKTPFADTELKFILVSILEALKKVHEKNMVHGNIQPETIMLGKDGEPLLTGFAGASLATAAHTGKLAGEVSVYSAPEFYEQAFKIGPASDFYGLGATIYCCMTGNAPTASPSRMVAQSKGQLDPVLAALSESMETTYSTELVQAIKWMLQPKYDDRPQSVDEIVTLLNAELSTSKTGSVKSKQENPDVADSRPVANSSLWVGAAAGLVALAILGLWFTNKTSDIVGEKSSAVTAQALPQNVDKKIVTPVIDNDQSVALSAIPSNQGPKLDETPGPIQKSTDKEILLKERIDSDQSKTVLVAEHKPSSVVSDSEQKNSITTKAAAAKTQTVAVEDKSLLQPKKPNSPTTTSVSGYLAAARRAMKAVHLTTPPGDNAYKYYQMVLAVEPDNAEALAGLQKIVDRYAWFIRKSKAEGKLDTAKRVLQKAESVLPNDPKLQRIRAELTAKE